MSRFDDLWSSPAVSTARSDVDEGLRTYMIGVFGYMAIGLLITALIAFAASRSLPLMQLMFGTPLRWVVAFAPFGVVMFLSMRLHTLSFSTAKMLFIVYAGLIGLSISSIFPIYQDQSIARIFLVSASVFGGMSLYGYTTKKDLTSMGSFLVMGLIGVIVASLMNIFFHSSTLATILSILCVLIFTGLTAYDTQKIKEVYWHGDAPDVLGKKAIFGALQLYLDFLNIFLALLHLFGDRRN
jgi:FtsH-binding integral membrane protein